MLKSKTIAFTTILGLISLSTFDRSVNHSLKKTTVEGYIKNHPVKFLENRGQMMDMAGKPVPFVLFKASAPGIDLYLTEKGLTYVFSEAKAEDNNEKELKRKVKYREIIPGPLHDGKMPVRWERIDMNLVSASIKNENIIKEDPSTHHLNYFY